MVSFYEMHRLYYELKQHFLLLLVIESQLIEPSSLVRSGGFFYLYVDFMFMIMLGSIISIESTIILTSFIINQQIQIELPNTTHNTDAYLTEKGCPLCK
jgi:hypothetical protein